MTPSRRAQSLPTRRSARLAAARSASAPDPDASSISGRIAQAPTPTPPPPPPPPPTPPPPPPPTPPPQPPPPHVTRYSYALPGLFGLLLIILCLSPHPPRSTTAVAPPCHVRVNSSSILPPCALFPDLNRVLAHVSKLRRAGPDGEPVELSPHFFRPVHLHMQDDQSDDDWYTYVSGERTEQAVNDMQSDADLARHAHNGIKCARHDLDRQLWYKRLLLPLFPTSCTLQEHQQHFASVAAILRSRLRAVAGSLDNDAMRDHQLERKAEARLASIHTQVQHLVDRMEGQSIDMETSQLALLRNEYASWLVEGMRWSCRAREYDYANAMLGPAWNHQQRRPSGMTLSGIDIRVTEIADEASLHLAIRNFTDLILNMPTGALTRERQCILQHAQDAFSYCVPSGFDVAFRDTNGNLHHIVQHLPESDDPLPVLCEHILDPHGKGCSTTPHRVWWAWHNLANLSLISSSTLATSSSPGLTPPPHLRHCFPQNRLTPLHHWTRHLRPPTTARERSERSMTKGRVAPQFGIVLPLDTRAAQGKVHHLEPWMGILHVDGGIWKEDDDERVGA